MDFVSESLQDRHRLTAFDCGKPEMNLWLQNSAHQAERMRTCRTTVWHRGDGVVVGHYGLTAHVIERDQLPRRLGRGKPDRIPAVLIARLALDSSLQGNGLGGVLLVDALGRIIAATNNVAAYFVVVDAIDDEAAKFYARHQFEQTPRRWRMVRKVSDIAADFAAEHR